MGTAESIADRLAEVRARVAAACARAGRRPEEVTLVGVSKGQPLARLRAAHQAGLTVFGENRVQEAAAKAPEMPRDVEWHLIGPLQSNKVKPAVEIFHIVHSVDRLKIARALDREAGARGRRLPCFLEINLGGEESKHGFAPDEISAAPRPLAELEHLEVLGLMAIPPFEDEPEAARPWFRRLRELRDRLREASPWRHPPGALSMGMSHDFEIAIEEGATHVRVGTAIFGPRGEA